MLVTPSRFEGDIAIGQVEYADVAARVQLLIDKYEPFYLWALLGARLAGELQQGMAEEQPAQKWKELAAHLTRPCALMCYYFYQRQNATATTVAGEVVEKVDNGIRASSVLKQVSAWNEMVALSLSALKWVRERTEDYGTVAPESMDMFRLINELGI